MNPKDFDLFVWFIVGIFVAVPLALKLVKNKLVQDILLYPVRGLLVSTICFIAMIVVLLPPCLLVLFIDLALGGKGNVGEGGGFVAFALAFPWGGFLISVCDEIRKNSFVDWVVCRTELFLGM